MIIPQECVPLLLEQRTHYTEDPAASYVLDLQNTYNTFKHLLPIGNRVLDIGCGMAGIDVLLDRHYRGANITLVDKQGVSPTINSGFHEQAESFSHYHDFELALSLLRANGVDRPRTIDVSTQPFPDQEFFDVVISLLSWGFHYPIDTYSPNVAEGGVVIADIRKGTDGLSLLEKYGEVKVVHESRKYVRAVAVSVR